MSVSGLIDNIKGATSVRLFLFLSIGITISRFIPSFSIIYPRIIIPSLFLVAIILHLIHQPRLSILIIYLLLISYGLFLANFSLIQDKLSNLSPHFSIARDVLLSLSNAKISKTNLPLLSALTLGDRTLLSSDLVADFRVSGVAHVLVVSGMHVGFIYLLISVLIRRLPCKRVTTILGLFILWGYAALVGFTLSVCRAVFMFSVMLILRMVGESYRSFHALFLAAFLQLLISPSSLFDVSFQLSYSAVLSILVFYPLFPSVTIDRKSNIWKSLLKYIYNPIRLTISAQILIAPLVAYYFGQFPLYFILTNLAITFLVPGIFIGGFLLFIPFLGTLIAYPLDLLLDLLRLIVSVIASLPMALVQVRISFLFLVLVYMLIGLVVWYAYTDWRFS